MDDLEFGDILGGFKLLTGKNIKYLPILGEKFLRFDKEKSNHERKECFVGGFDVSLVEKNKYILHLKSINSNKPIIKQIKSTTYKVKKI